MTIVNKAKIGLPVPAKKPLVQ